MEIDLVQPNYNAQLWRRRQENRNAVVIGQLIYIVRKNECEANLLLATEKARGTTVLFCFVFFFFFQPARPLQKEREREYYPHNQCR